MSAAAPLHALVDEQNALVREASLALPGQFTQCTYDLGYLKQAVYLCLTCAEPRGICSACSIACHGDHEQIELFPKRHFRCDCPTSALAHACTLKSPVQPLNADNIYGQNYTGGGLFCRCSTTYDAKLERETMVQCLACEEWFHESCLNLRERVPPRLPETETEAPGITEAPDEARSEVTSVCSDADIPPALVPGDAYDALICGPCVLKNPTVKRYAGTQGVRMVVPKTDGPGFTLIGKDAEEEAGLEVEVVRERHEAEDTAEIGTKRRAAGDGDEGSAPSKRPRPAQDGASTCLAPPINALAQSTLLSSTGSGSRAYGDVFLS